MIRRAVPLSFLGFVLLVVASGLLFAVAGRTADRAEGYQDFLAVERGPVVVVNDPADLIPPSTSSSVTASVTAISLSLPGPAADIVFNIAESLGLDVLQAQAIRTTQTWSYPDGRPRASIGVALVTESGYVNVIYFSTDQGDRPVVYLPPVTLLPPELVPGSSTISESLTNGLDPVTVTVTVLDDTAAPAVLAAADDGDCVPIRTVFDQRFVDPGSTGYVIEQVDLWCRGRGVLVASSESPLGEIVTRVVNVDAVEWPSVEPLPLSPRPPGSLLRSPIPGTSIFRAPVAVPGGLIAVNEALSDLLAITVRELDEGDPGITWTTAWLQHPSGSLLGIAADDERIGVTTSRRSLQTYDHAGRLLWSVDLPDVAAGPPVMLDDVVIVALLDGSVRAFAADSGAERWSVGFPDAVPAAPVRAGDAVLAMDLQGRTVIVDASGAVVSSGQLGRADGPASGLADGSFLIPHSQGALTLLDRFGAERWSTSLTEGSLSSTAELWGDVIAVPTSSGLLGLDAQTGATRWELPEFTRADVGPRGLVANLDQVVQVSEDGSVSVLSRIRESDGSEPLALFITRMGDAWAAISSGGTLEYLAVPGE